MIVREHRPWCSEDIETNGIGKRDAAGHRLREEYLPASTHSKRCA